MSNVKLTEYCSLFATNQYCLAAPAHPSAGKGRPRGDGGARGRLQWWDLGENRGGVLRSLTIRFNTRQTRADLYLRGFVSDQEHQWGRAGHSTLPGRLSSCFPSLSSSHLPCNNHYLDAAKPDRNLCKCRGRGTFEKEES